MRRVSGGICKKRVFVRMKGKVFKMVVRRALLETVAQTERQEAELVVAEVKMQRFSLRVH